MAAPATPLTASRDTRESDGEIVAYKMADDITIYKGAIVEIGASDGLVTNFTDADAAAFVGIAYEKKTSVAGTTSYIRVLKTGVHRLAWYDDDAIAAADVGDEVYAFSSAEVCPNATGSLATNKVTDDIKCGKVVGYDGTVPLVRIDDYT